MKERKRRAHRDPGALGKFTANPPIGSSGSDGAKLLAGLEWMRRNGRCRLCGGPPDQVTFWIPRPEGQRRLHARSGSARVVVVAFCDSCFVLPDVHGRAETLILAEASRMFGPPEKG